jgi:hypothetical protein
MPQRVEPGSLRQFDITLLSPTGLNQGIQGNTSKSSANYDYEVVIYSLQLEWISQTSRIPQNRRLCSPLQEDRSHFAASNQSLRILFPFLIFSRSQVNLHSSVCREFLLTYLKRFTAFAS